jgi:hypothetical protein
MCSLNLLKSLSGQPIKIYIICVWIEEENKKDRRKVNLCLKWKK